MARAWHTSLTVLVVAWALLAWHLHATDTATTATDPTTLCIRSSPRYLSRDQAARLCIHAADGLDDGPAQCAASAQRPNAAGFAATNNAEAMEDVLSLCESATDSRPAECWTSAMTSQIHRSSEWRRALTVVCKSANDTLPAQCLMEFKRNGLVPTKGAASRQESPMDVAIEICKSFRGDTPAIGTCLSRASRSLSEIARYKLCRRGNTSTVVDVVDCAKQLLQRNTKPEIIVRVCATAAKPDDLPQTCVLAAQQQVRWMEDTGAVAHLCENSKATAAPVQCAIALRSWFIAQFTKGHPIHDLARLCHGATDSTSIVECVNKLPSQLFRAEQVVHLCAHTTSGVSLSSVNCVVAARPQLFGLDSLNADEDASGVQEEQGTLLLELCDKSNAPYAPLDCLDSTTAQKAHLSAQQRVRLCQHASSSAPHQCFRAIHASLLARLPNQTADGIELCRQATSLGPAICLNQLQRSSVAFLQSGLAMELCKNALSASPAECFHAAPSDFTDRDKIELCAQASSDVPAECAKVYLPRMGDNSMMALLCSKAMSAAPARCASSSPFGMSALEIVALCQEAIDDKPAQCARVVPPNLRVPWRDVATVCRAAMSTTPGSCLAHRVRQRVSLSQQLITECQSMVSSASTIDLVQFAYECVELMPRCPIIVKARVLDQFGDDMPALSHGYAHFSATPDSEDDVTLPILRGVTVVPIVNGSVLFHELYFAEAGNFTLRLSSPGVEEMVARVHVHTNETEKRERDHCASVFAFMECAPPQPLVVNTSSPQSDMPLQILRLRNRFVLVGLPCESLWSDQHAGLKAVGSDRDAKLFALPRIAYQLLTGHNIPTAAMSSWECLGIPEGSNRSAIRRAYHKRSLEWHPDKWSSATLGEAAVLRDKVEAVYAFINDAYQQLTKQ